MKIQRVLAVAAALATAVTLSACGNNKSSTIVGKKNLTIGVKNDQPGLGFQDPSGKYVGFDIEIAKLVAAELGVPENNITFKTTVSANREPFIQQGQVDYVVGSYTINADRKTKVSFAGPYLVAGQDLLIKKTDTSITGPESLKGKRVCSVTGSTSIKRIQDNYKDAQVQGFDVYSKCVEALLNGSVDTVTSDNTVLAGYAAQHPDQLKLVGKTFSQEPYGIGLAHDDTQGRNAINDALQKIMADGRWKAAWDRTLGLSGTAAPATPSLDRY